MTFIAQDAWTCPQCEETTRVDGPLRDVDHALRAIRDQHTCGDIRREQIRRSHPAH